MFASGRARLGRKGTVEEKTYDPIIENPNEEDPDLGDPVNPYFPGGSPNTGDEPEEPGSDDGSDGDTLSPENPGERPEEGSEDDVLVTMERYARRSSYGHVYIAVDRNHAAYSPEGLSWFETDWDQIQGSRRMVSNGYGKVVWIVGNKLMSSGDSLASAGVENGPYQDELADVAYGGGIFVAVGGNTVVVGDPLTGFDTYQVPDLPGELTRIRYCNTMWVATAYYQGRSYAVWTADPILDAEGNAPEWKSARIATPYEGREIVGEMSYPTVMEDLSPIAIPFWAGDFDTEEDAFAWRSEGDTLPYRTLEGKVTADGSFSIANGVTLPVGNERFQNEYAHVSSRFWFNTEAFTEAEVTGRIEVGDQSWSVADPDGEISLQDMGECYVADRSGTLTLAHKYETPNHYDAHFIDAYYSDFSNGRTDREIIRFTDPDKGTLTLHFNRILQSNVVRWYGRGTYGTPVTSGRGWENVYFEVYVVDEDGNPATITESFTFTGLNNGNGKNHLGVTQQPGVVAYPINGTTATEQTIVKEEFAAPFTAFVSPTGSGDYQIDLNNVASFGLYLRIHEYDGGVRMRHVPPPAVRLMDATLEMGGKVFSGSGVKPGSGPFIDLFDEPSTTASTGAGGSIMCANVQDDIDATITITAAEAGGQMHSFQDVGGYASLQVTSGVSVSTARWVDLRIDFSSPITGRINIGNLVSEAGGGSGFNLGASELIGIRPNDGSAAWGELDPADWARPGDDPSGIDYLWAEPGAPRYAEMIFAGCSSFELRLFVRGALDLAVSPVQSSDLSDPFELTELTGEENLTGDPGGQRVAFAYTGEDLFERIPEGESLELPVSIAWETHGSVSFPDEGGLSTSGTEIPHDVSCPGGKVNGAGEFVPSPYAQVILDGGVGVTFDTVTFSGTFQGVPAEDEAAGTVMCPSDFGVLVKSSNLEEWESRFRENYIPDNWSSAFFDAEKRVFLVAAATENITNLLASFDMGKTWKEAPVANAPKGVYKVLRAGWKYFCLSFEGAFTRVCASDRIDLFPKQGFLSFPPHSIVYVDTGEPNTSESVKETYSGPLSAAPDWALYGYNYEFENPGQDGVINQDMTRTEHLVEGVRRVS